ncbi:hypothetical protein IPV08_23840 [Methylobacterium sp. SD274]|uniref:hypothetical protein n=1 Tax=Methylobacterium sp. SD274 TaxID=2782009 RepID=UPI001A97685F|nr:hypothetical protein [Methylobacterium sp. SD274]MBO1022992.1 hypothetical protein [Methylobacterium sp. SD274]
MPQKLEKTIRCPVYGLAFILALAPASAAEPITGRASAIDGDTLLHEHREIAAIAITYDMFLSGSLLSLSNSSPGAAPASVF